MVVTSVDLYQNLAKQSEQLSYRDKFRLAQLLIQLARKEEEETHPQGRVAPSKSTPTVAPKSAATPAPKPVPKSPTSKQAVASQVPVVQGVGAQPDQETIRYVAERLAKLRPNRKATVLNSIAAMFQFRGGISDADKEFIFSELVRRKYLSVSASGHVSISAA